MARKKRLPKFLREAEVEAMIAAAAAEGPRDELLVRCAFRLGLRVSELAKLKPGDVDLEEGQVFVDQGKGAKDRYVPIPSSLRPHLERGIARAIANRQPYLFPSPRGPSKPLTTRSIQYLFGRLAEAAGVDRIRVTPHKARHTYATQVLNLGANLREVQELLGHENIATTEQYTWVTMGRLRSTVDRLN